jgi:hypothetical protein
MAQALDNTSDLPDERRKALRRLWLIGLFNFATSGLEKDFTGSGELTWAQSDENDFRLLYQSPYGLTCPLAKLYRQADDTWAAMVVAGVRDNPFSAMAAAEWAVSRLTAE